MLGTSKSVWGFDPRSILGCQLWLDGADESSLVLSGSSVTQWSDKSGNGLTVSAASSQPTYVRNAANGLGTVAFNGSQGLSAGTVTGEKLLGNTGTSATFCVLSVSNSSVNSSPFTWDDSGYTFRYMLTVEGAQGVNFDLGNISSQGSRINIPTSSVTLANNTYYLVSFWKNGSTAVLNINGGAYTTTSSSFSTNWSTSASRIFNIGTYINNSGLNMKGNIAEILFYNTHIPNDFKKVEGYLAHKWGLTASYSQTVPLTIPGCQLWLDGIDRSSMTFSGSTITQWNDKSGNGYNATIAPDRVGATYSTTYNAVNFASSTTGYITNYSAAPTNETMFVVGNNPSPSGANNIIIGGVSGARSLGLGYSNPNGTGTIGNLNTQVVWLASVGGYTAGTTALVRSQFTPSSNSVSFNGGSTGTGGAPGFTAGRVTYLGVDATNGYYHYNGYMMEALFYNRILTTTEIQTIEGYLAKKWGIGPSSSIPSTHPFSKIPPYLRVFQPIDIPGCSLWLDAADLSSLTLSGSNLTAIRDKSGVTTPTVTPGFLYASNSLNGHGVIYNNNGHIRGTFPTPLTSSIHTTFIVAVANSLPSDGTRLMSFRAPSGLPIRPLDYAFGSFRYLVRNPNTTGQQVTAFTNSYFIWTCYNSSSNLGLRLNGATDLTTNITTNPTTITGYGFGWNDEGDTQINFPGKIAESLVFNTALTTAQIQQIEWYLANKWGIFSTSPVSTPLTIPGSGIWLDGADTSSMTFSSGAITQWRDKSGSSNHFGLTRGTATSILDNGRNVVNFGEATVMTSTNSISFTNSSAFFIVSKMTSTNGAQDLLGFPSFGNGFALRFFSSILYSGNGDDLSLGNYYVNGNFNPSYPSTTYYNTYSLISTLVPSRGGTTLISLSDNWLLEGHAQRFFIGNIAEFIFYPGGVTNIQRQKIEGYLANKWGLTVPAPTVHPYDKYPPASLHTVVIPTSVRLINLGASGGGTSGSFTMNSIVGGGTGTFTNSATFDGSSGTWGMAQCFDGARSGLDLYMVANPNFMELVFPRELMVTRIFLVPREQQDAFPSSLTLKADGTLVGTYTSTTVSQALGMGISYSGTGYYIQPAAKGTTWRFDFTSTPVSFGEIEFWGYLPS